MLLRPGDPGARLSGPWGSWGKGVRMLSLLFGVESSHYHLLAV